MRNSTALRVTTNVDGVSTFVAVRTTAGGVARCHAFFFDSSASALYERTSTTAITAPTPGAVDSAWTQLGASIKPVVATSGTRTPVFTAQGTRGLAISFTVDRPTGPASLFVTAVTGRAPLANVSPQCF